MKALCAELLRYGGAAQSYKGYRTDALADGAMTEAHKAYLTNEGDIAFNNNNVQGSELNNPTVTWAGKALDLNTRVTIVYVIDTAKYTGNRENLTLKLQYEDTNGNLKETVLTDPRPYGNAEGRLAFRFDGLLAAELRSVIVAQVYDGNTAVSNTLTYSADTYGNGKTDKLLTLCKALIAYSDKAKIYFSSNG